jgi:hypothetical protein
MINWLNFGIAVAWFCKIGFHFAYLKEINKNIKAANFISFFLKIENLATSILITHHSSFRETLLKNVKIKAQKGGQSYQPICSGLCLPSQAFTCTIILQRKRR